MSITLKPEQEKLIQQQLDLRQFQSADEVLERALQLLSEQYGDDYQKWIEDVRLKVDEAKAEAERDDVIPLDEISEYFVMSIIIWTVRSSSDVCNNSIKDLMFAGQCLGIFGIW
jgi:antitoxin ParD1/3/4